MEQTIPERLSTLGHPQRLAVFRLLMRRYPDRVPATELAEALALKPNTLSSYVAALMRANLVTQERVGTSRRYAANMQVARDTLDYLFLDCCRGRPDICAPDPDTPRAVPSGRSTQKVLFVCTGNSARSLFAEAILKREAPKRFDVFSAGTQPRTRPHPLAIKVLKENGHEISGLRPKDLATFRTSDAPKFDLVLTVCDRAANEDSPAWPGQPVTGHWGLPDPAREIQGTGSKVGAFRAAYLALQNRLSTFAALDVAGMDRRGLQQALDDIGQIKPGDPA